MAEHDQLFKRAFRIPEHAAGELEAVLPRALFEAIDRGSLRLVQSDVVDHRLGERFADALFSASFRGVAGYVWLLLEHHRREIPDETYGYVVGVVAAAAVAADPGAFARDM